MYRDIIINKWSITILGFLVVFGILCYFWYKPNSERHKHIMSSATEFLHQLAKKQKNAEKVDGASVENITHTDREGRTKTVVSRMKSSDLFEVKRDREGKRLNENTTDTTENMRVSRHGFGAFPEIPEGAPINPFIGSENRDQELLKRVVIKKWNEGVRFSGASIVNGIVYLNYPNTVYVQYGDSILNKDGTITRPITRVRGSKSAFILEKQMRTGEVPAGLTVLEIGKDGIDAYKYLNLR